jgi:lambda family phage portal protein
MFDSLRKTLARAISPPKKPSLRTEIRRALKEERKASAGKGADSRMYHAARLSRTTSGWMPATGSADSELRSSLRTLRDRCRALVRDAAYAKRAKVVVQNNVIGASGVGMQAQVMSTRDALRRNVNDAIEAAWEEWSCGDDCHTGRTLHFADIERMALGEIFETGEVFIRKHIGASFAGDSGIPLALEIIESERIADEFTTPVPPGPIGQGNVLKMGVEVDSFGAPQAYWIRTLHPGEFPNLQQQFPTKIERVPADQIYHIRLVDRWPQTRGEPWLHSVARKLNDMDAYSEAELTAARGQASYFASIKSPKGQTALANADPNDPSGQRQMALESGILYELAEGEELNFHASTRPNSALDPFMRYMIREFAAGVGPSYESISRDYSQHNYSSSRLALLDDRDLWRVLQGWWIRMFRYPLHEDWLQLAVLGGAIPEIPLAEYASAPEKFECVLFKPRGWGWIDPVKEVDAYRQALISGFTTRADIIREIGNGRDIEDVDRQRRKELADDKQAGQLPLVFDTSPEAYMAAGAPKPATSSPEAGAGGSGGGGGGEGGRSEGERVVPIRR